MVSAVPEMERRRQATEKTVARYEHKIFSWKDGITCVHLARYQLRNMGHRVPALPRFRSSVGAKQIMAARGWTSSADMLNSHLPRIAPAMMLLGDLVVMPSDYDEEGEPVTGIGAIFICAGPSAFFGWRDDFPEPQVIEISLSHAVGAWRV